MSCNDTGLINIIRIFVLFLASNRPTTNAIARLPHALKLECHGKNNADTLRKACHAAVPTAISRTWHHASVAVLFFCFLVSSLLFFLVFSFMYLVVPGQVQGLLCLFPLLNRDAAARVAPVSIKLNTSNSDHFKNATPLDGCVSALYWAVACAT